MPDRLPMFCRPATSAVCPVTSACHGAARQSNHRRSRPTDRWRCNPG